MDEYDIYHKKFKFNLPNNITLENKYILTNQKNKERKEKGNNDENLVFVYHKWWISFLTSNYNAITFLDGPSWNIKCSLWF